MTMNYKNEREHDSLLICLLEDLNAVDQLSIVSHAFGIEPLGTLKRAERRRPFDVELTFSNNLSLVIETKVDADEQGRWDECLTCPPF